MRSTGDGDEALYIFVARVLGRRRHCSSTAGQGGPHSMTISDCFWLVRKKSHRAKIRHVDEKSKY